jgi:hypothetical protein
VLEVEMMSVSLAVEGSPLSQTFMAEMEVQGIPNEDVAEMMVGWRSASMVRAAGEHGEESWGSGGGVWGCGERRKGSLEER